MTHSEVRRLKRENWPRVTYCDFTGENLKKSDEVIQDSVEDGVDLVGHGTHIAVTVMRIAKWAEIYVARVVDSEGNLNPQSIRRVSIISRQPSYANAAINRHWSAQSRSGRSTLSPCHLAFPKSVGSVFKN
jgi:hypothetical protein